MRQNSLLNKLNSGYKSIKQHEEVEFEFDGDEDAQTEEVIVVNKKKKQEPPMMSRSRVNKLKQQRKDGAVSV